MENAEAQSDEIIALAAIYDSNIFMVDELDEIRRGQFVARPQLVQPFNVNCKLTGDETASNVYPIEHLPPLTLHFQLPPGYPSESAPEFTLSCKWLTREQLGSLCRRMDEIWEEHREEVVLFHWCFFLTDEALKHLGINDTIDVCPTPAKPVRRGSDTKSLIAEDDANYSEERSNRHYNSSRTVAQNRIKRTDSAEQGATIDKRAVQELPPDANLLPVILEYDQQRRQQVFDKQIFSCNICFDEKMGSQCLAFKGCNHVFCRDCIKSYFEVQINSGNVQLLNCPEEKCTSQALPTQVRELVAPELFAKYDRMLLSSTLDTMSDIVYCPRRICQCPVLVEPNSTMANCPACFHSFCILCKMAYHGVVPCRIKAGDFQKLCDEYNKAPEEEKRLMEKRYGRNQLRNVVHNMLSEVWVETNSKRCPNCYTPIEKRDGCNKMTCFRCNCFFCWLCMGRLDKYDPYNHYNNNSSPCFNLLFRGADPESDGDDELEELGLFL